MYNNSVANEVIELDLPLNGAYVSTARLTVASIANRIGFDVNEIEDLKAAVSEASVYIIKKAPADFNGTFHIKFIVTDNFIEISLNINASIDFGETDEDMGLVMIKALMDNLSADSTEQNKTQITMIKAHKKTAF